MASTQYISMARSPTFSGPLTLTGCFEYPAVTAFESLLAIPALSPCSFGGVAIVLIPSHNAAWGHLKLVLIMSLNSCFFVEWTAAPDFVRC